MNSYPTFKEWQLQHAKKHGQHLRYNRLKTRWDIRERLEFFKATMTIWRPIKKAIFDFGESLKKLTPVFEAVNQQFKTTNTGDHNEEHL